MGDRLHALAKAGIVRPGCLERTLNGNELNAVIAETLAREARAAEQARRAAWQRTVENAASFGDPLGRNTWVGCTTST